MEVTKMRQWLMEFKTYVKNSIFNLQVVEGILYPYENVQDETKYLKYITGEEFGNIEDNQGNALICRYTENPITISGKMASVELVLIGVLPFCNNVDAFSNLVVQRLMDRLVIEGDIEVQKNMIEVFKTEISEDSTKMKSEMPLVTIAFTLKTPIDNIKCDLNDLVCDCSPSMIMSC